MNDFADYQAEDARLVILKELHRQLDGRLNEGVLTRVLESFGHHHSREWVRTQLRKLEELGAITIIEIGSVFVAQITRAGRDHVELRSAIEGAARPA
ncbi:MAG TPA: hypothetical protein VIJ42_09290 [Stellaceae bacterium]